MTNNEDRGCGWLVALVCAVSWGGCDGEAATEQVAQKLGAGQSGVEVACNFLVSPDAFFNARASLSGDLLVTGRLAEGALRVAGSLQITTRADGRADQSYPAVAVEGSLPLAFGSSIVMLQVISGASDLHTLYLHVGNGQLPPGLSEIVVGGDLNYYTACSGSRVQLPPGGDLIISDVTSNEGNDSLSIRITNVGTEPANVATPSRVRVGNNVAFATVPLDSKGNDAIEIPPGESSWLYLSATLPRCTSTVVRIDVDQLWQQPLPFDPFGNDTFSLEGPCLRWTTPLGPRSLGWPRSEWTTRVPAHVNYNPLRPLHIEGYSLQEIVSSVTVARAADGAPCSYCHHPMTRFPTVYQPPAGLLEPQVVYSGRSWNGSNTRSRDPLTRAWAQRFVAHDVRTNPATNPFGDKPGYLVDFFQRWLDDGATF